MVCNLQQQLCFPSSAFSLAFNRVYLGHLPSLPVLKDQWGKSNVMWYFRGQTGEKKFVNHSGVCLFQTTDNEEHLT